MTAAFAAAVYAAVEGGAPAAVTVRLSADPERTLVLPLTVAHTAVPAPPTTPACRPARA